MTKPKKIMTLSVCAIASLSMMITPVAAIAANTQITADNEIISGIEGRSSEYDPYDFIDEADEATKKPSTTDTAKNTNNKETKSTYNSARTSSNPAVRQEKGIHLNIDNVAESSNLTKNQIKSFIKEYTEWEGLEDYLIECDKEINLIFLLAVARTETGGGESCVGTYNCFNIKGRNGKYRDYDSYEESIDHFIRLINDSYISPDGKYYCGEGIDDIGVHYATSKWSPYVTKLANQLYDKFSQIDP